jgi:hypothetical protein
VGAWRRRSIAVPGGVPCEPCEAWWLQADELFVDVRVTTPGNEGSELPYSSTRAFAGRFEIAEGQSRWHLDLDSAGLAPRTDAADATGLYRSVDDPRLLIEDAPGRFREEWVDHGGPDVDAVSAPDLIAVRIGSWCGAVWSHPEATAGRIWQLGGRAVAAVGEPAQHRPPGLPGSWGWP